MNKYILKKIKYVLVTFSIFIMFMVITPILFTDKETYDFIINFYNSYKSMYVINGSTEYSVVIKGVEDTADDFLTKFSDNSYMESDVYKKEVSIVKEWSNTEYSGKDKLIRNISKLMKEFDYAPAKSSSKLKMLLDNRSIRVLVIVKSVMYSIRFKDPIVYTMLVMSALVIVLGVIYLCISDGDDTNVYYDEDYEDYEIYDDFDEIESNKVFEDKSNVERRISMKR